MAFGRAVAADDPAQLFAQGRSAFDAQNYDAALDAFERALTAGLDGPAIHFNIGVAAYRAGNYARAQAAFLEVARTPAMAALAHYNLGLVALRRNDPRAAAELFSRAAAEATDERLRGLATTQLASLPPPPAPNWVAYASAEAGYDDNVALVANSDVLGVSRTADSFAQAQAAISWPLDRPWHVDASLVWLDYQTLDEFDQLAMHGGAYYRIDRGPWTYELGGQLAYTLLDGRSFQSDQIALAQANTDLAREWHLRLRYQFDRISGQHEFTGLGGHRQNLAARLAWEPSPWRFAADVEFERNDLHDAMLASSRRQVSLSATRIIDEHWQAGIDFALRHTRFESDASGTENRTDAALFVSRSLAERWRVLGRYSYARNAADVADFDYRRNRISVSVEAIF